MQRYVPGLFFLLFSTGQAANRPDIVQQGFSPDARYHLLLTSFIQDGSGFPSAVLQITDVQRNATIYSQTRTWKDAAAGATLQMLVTAWRTDQTKILAKYHLTSPVAGEQLFNRPALPPQRYPDNVTVSQPTRVGLLTLVPLTLHSTCGYSDLPARGVILKLGSRELQHDRRLPASRTCATGYTLETAWEYRKSLVIIVRAYSQGFEGPDASPLVITTHLK